MKITLQTLVPRLFFGAVHYVSTIIVMSLLLSWNVYSQWIPQSIPVNKPIIGLEFVDENTGWAITENTSITDTAYIIASTDGGTTWVIQFRGNIGLQSLDAINATICYAGGVDENGDALFIKTSNSGLNWLVNNIGANKVPDDMFFLNEDTGYTCDNFSGGVYLTTDAGLTWLNREEGITAFPRTLYFLNYDTGYCGGGFYFFKTTNAGVNWNQLFQFGENVMDVQFKNQNLGWVALTGNKVGITTNGGTSWDYSSPTSIGGGTVPSVFFTNDSVGWCGTRTQRIFKSTNGGLNWITQIDSSGSLAIHIYNSLTGWSGDNGISKTINGGVTFISGIGSEIPNSFRLNQNYPNPFNPSTKIGFTITQSSDVVILIYDILGREIFKWKSEGVLHPGIYEYNYTGEGLSGGVYIYKLIARSSNGKTVFTDSKKMIYLK